MRIGGIPYVSNLTANRYGLSAWFSDTMDPEHMLDSLGGAYALQLTGRTANPDILDVRNPSATGCNPPLVLNAAGTGCITPEQAAAEPQECGTFDIPCQLSKAWSSDVPLGLKDVAKRVGLVVLALVLLAVAIISLR